MQYILLHLKLVTSLSTKLGHQVIAFVLQLLLAEIHKILIGSSSTLGATNAVMRGKMPSSGLRRQCEIYIPQISQKL